MRPRSGFTVIELIIVTLILAVIIAIAVPNVLSSRKTANEGAAIGALKTIANAQSLFREKDREDDDSPDYASLAELSNTTIIDSPLGSGRRNGYAFETDAGSLNREAVWFAVANPIVPKSTGDRYFCTNHRCVIYYTLGTSVTPDYVDCTIPTSFLQVE
jgi:prepilin-type N-terminal cleavage/methylation domain-containing protein